VKTFEYTSFSASKIDEIIGDQKVTEELYQKFRNAVGRPNLIEFCEYQRQQYIQALESGAVDWRWDQFLEMTKGAEAALEDGDISLIATAFYELGKAAEKLRHPDHDEMAELYTAKVDKMRREYPIFKRNLEIDFLKKMSQSIAELAWRDDIDQAIRLSEACEMVWPQLVEMAVRRDMQDLLPDKASSLRDWLRPIAPDYARKGGRPKKIKK
tara:strand:- start:1708 stop:2343 length:636 start_codon:yes stop_codon:yes gene_type:complete